MNRYKFLLNMQNFAEGDDQGGTQGAGSQGGQSGAEGTGSAAIDYDKLADIVGKRSQTAEDSALRGYLKEQGITGDDLQKAVNSFKTEKAAKAQETANKQSTLEQENQALKNSLQTMRLNNEIANQAAALNVAASKAPYLSKLVDTTGLINDKGEIVSDKVKEALENVLKDFPELREQSNTVSQTGFTQIGSGSGTDKATLEDQLNAAFGIRKK